MSEVAWAGRPRPLSSGLWTLLGWLRRDSSTDSLSSVGSDRTTRSFAFLPPGRYHHAAATPLPTPPQGPPTDSYKRRLRETKLRRQRERDLTLAGKYHLPVHDNITYDAFSLPPARLTVPSARERLRRAKSECGERVRAHVPGKRRAPPPPAPASAATLPRPRRTAKRRAPPPPTHFIRTAHSLRAATVSNMDTLLPNNIKQKTEPKPTDESKVTPKLRSEKSFIRQIFESKKRNSAIESTHARLLPSISELDRQATQLIENYKLKTFERDNNALEDKQPDKDRSDGDMWICTNCLRKYDAEVITCFYCIFKDEPMEKRKNKQLFSFVTPTNNSSSLSDDEDKEKLKEMLKDMKNSLRKRSSIDEPKAGQNVLLSYPTNNLETPTLPIGSRGKKLAESNNVDTNHPGPSGCNSKSEAYTNNRTPQSVINISYTPIQVQTTENFPETKSFNISLLNPVYIPKDETKLVQLEACGNFKDSSSQLSKENKGECSSNTNFSPVTNDNHSKTNIVISDKVTEVHELHENTSDHEPPEPQVQQELKAVIKGKQKVHELHENTSDHEPPEPQVQQELKAVIKGKQKVHELHENTSDHEPPEPQVQQELKAVIKGKQKVHELHENTSDHEPPEPQVQQELKAVIKGKQKASSSQKVNNSAQTEDVHIKPNATKYFKRRQMLNQLEKSIAAGDEAGAAEAAIKLAQLRLNCSVLSFTPPTELNNRIALLEQNAAAKICKEDAKETRNNNLSTPSTSKTRGPTEQTAENNISRAGNGNTPNRVQVWVEDRCAARGPAPVPVCAGATLGDLRLAAEAFLGVPSRLQRWVVSQTLALDDTACLEDLAGRGLDAPFYLCVVETCDDEKAVYKELLQLEQRPIVSNSAQFECGVCLEECAVGEGVVLRECAHEFCRGCVAACARAGGGLASCPAPNCPGSVQPRELRALLSASEYEACLRQQLAAVESADRHAFHCRTRDCAGWAFCDPGVLCFPCPVCHASNCLPCQAIHEGETCKEYRKRLQDPSQDQEEIETRSLLDKMIADGEALACPECNAIITKKWGCDFVKCASCKTDICWVTRGRRWGPKGTGDTSGGCRCGLDGKRCHPSCGYCH